MVLFRHIGGRSPKPGASTDARAQGVTLARIHAAAENYAGGKARMTAWIWIISCIVNWLR